jgi:hypothetical protein
LTVIDVVHGEMMKSRHPPFSAFHPERRRLSLKSTHVARDRPEACVSIGGAFALAHHDEIIDLVRRFEEGEIAARPGKRIVAVRADGGKLLIDTNDVRLARAIGETLRSNYQGDLKFHFGESDCLLRVHWQR